MPAPGPGKALCGAQRPNQPKGVTCKNVAGHMTDHVGTGRCARHGGNTPNHRTAAQREQARAACAMFNLDVGDREPGGVLLDEMQTGRAFKAYLESEIAFAVQDDDGERVEKLVRWWTEARKDLAKVAAAAEGLGLARRDQEFREDQARQVVAVLTECLRRLGLDPAAPEVRAAVRGSLLLIAGEKAA